MKNTITRSDKNGHLNWFARLGLMAFVVLAAVGFVWEASTLTKVPGEVGPGPGAVPAVLGLLLGAIALYYFFVELRSRPQDGAKGGGPPLNARQLSLVAGIFLAVCVGYGLGIIASVIFLSIWSGKFVDRFSWAKSIGVTTASVFILYLLFDLGLGVHLPLISTPW